MNISSLQKSAVVLIVTLVAINIIVFIKSMNMSNQIGYFESQILELRDKNTQIQENLYELQSITHSASIAAELGFDSYSEPIYITTPQYAFQN